MSIVNLLQICQMDFLLKPHLLSIIGLSIIEVVRALGVLNLKCSLKSAVESCTRQVLQMSVATQPQSLLRRYKDFLLGQTGLEEGKKTGRKKCYPICIMCLDAGKKVITYPKTKTNFTKKRKEDAADKAAGQTAKKSKHNK